MQTGSLEDRLVAAQEVGGGWAYYRGKRPRIEPTCWALLALSAPEFAPLGVSLLASLQGEDGLLRDPGTSSPNYGWNGLAILAMQRVPDGTHHPMFASLLDALLDARGVQLRPELNSAVPQDGMLQAWSWTPDTFSWLEPSAYCLLALKCLGDPRPEVAARIAEAEEVFIDRVCPVGGWNYGNSAVLGQDLRPYVPTTALGLLAMQGREDDAVARSLAWLEANALSERSTMALSLAALALAVHGRPYRPTIDLLAGLDAETGFLGNNHLMALALSAATIERHGAASFRVPSSARPASEFREGP